jgi:rRNA-processing protein FCF1
MQRVIFDSSFLMAVVESPTTWFEDIVDRVGKFEPVLLGCVEQELDRLASGHGRRSRSARVALDLASKFTKHSCGQAQVDDEIASAALSMGAVVATMDSGLANALRPMHVKVISLRSGRAAIS